MKWPASLALFMLLAATASAKPFDPFAAIGLAPPLGARLDRDLPVVDEDGRPATIGALSGDRPTILAPVQHHCPNICGATLGGLVHALDELRQGDAPAFSVLVFGIDPAETGADARVSLETLAKGVGPADSREIHATTASAATIETAMRELGFVFAYDAALRQFAHPAAIAVLAADGRLIRWIGGVAPERATVADALADAASGGALARLNDALVLLCYAYNPLTGEYTPAILAILRATGALFSLLLGSALIFLNVRARRKDVKP